MKLPRFSVRSMIWIVLVVALDFGWGLVIYRPESVFGVFHYLDLPLLGLFNVLAIAGYPLLARRKDRPIRVGFVGGGLFCAATSVMAFRTYPALGPEINVRSCLSIYDWIAHNIFQPGIPGYYNPRTLLFYVVIGALGMIPLVALSALFGLLNWLVAKGKVPWMIAVAIVASLTICGGVTLRWVEYERLETIYKEVCEKLSTEAADVSKELERLRAAGNAPSVEAEKPIKVLEERMTKYEILLAKYRRQLEIYRRAVRRPWLGVAE